jgi:hypothetical protein
MTESDMISEILRLELEIINKIITDRTFRPSFDDQFKQHRKKIEKLRKKLKNNPIINKYVSFNVTQQDF